MNRLQFFRRLSFLLTIVSAGLGQSVHAQNVVETDSHRFVEVTEGVWLATG